MAAAADAGRPSAAARLRVAWRVVRAAEVLALAVLLSRAFPRLPCAAATASSVLRVAASLLVHPRTVFLVANAIVILLLALSRRDVATPSHSSAWSSSDHDAQDQFLHFAAPPVLLPPVTEEEVFQDKQAVYVTVRAQPPRRSRSEKASSGGARRAASPELRRAESENGRRHRADSQNGQRRRRSTSAAAPEDWGAEDEGEFRRAVEAFIAKQQTRFHREESLVAVAVGGDDARVVAGVVGGDDAPAIAGAVVAAAKRAGACESDD